MSMMGGRGRGFGRPDDKGPKASFKSLIPYLGEHKKPLGIAIGLSIIGAAISLAQPLVVGQLINAVQAQQPTTLLAIILLGVVIGSAASDGLMRYLLAKSGEGIVRTAQSRWPLGYYACQSLNTTVDALAT